MALVRSAQDVQDGQSLGEDGRPFNYFYFPSQEIYGSGTIYKTTHTLVGTDVPPDQQIPTTKIPLIRLDSPLLEEDDYYTVRKKLNYLLDHPPKNSEFKGEDLENLSSHVRRLGSSFISKRRL